MAADKCRKGHPTPTAAYRTPNGTCRECLRQANQKHRMKQRAAWTIVKSLTDAGVTFENDGVPVAPEEVARQMVKVHADKFD